MTDDYTIIRDTTTLDAALDEFLDAFTGFMVGKIVGLMFGRPDIAQCAECVRLMNAAAWLDQERQKHAAAGIFDSAHYDNEQIAEILGGIRG